MGVAYSKRIPRGLCSRCGCEVSTSKAGIPLRQHKQRRVQRGPGGLPEVYKSDWICPGSFEPAEPLVSA